MSYLSTTQNSLPVAGQALLDGVRTRKVPMKGFKVVVTSHSPFPSLLGAIASTAELTRHLSLRADVLKTEGRNNRFHVAPGAADVSRAANHGRQGKFRQPAHSRSHRMRTRRSRKCIRSMPTYAPTPAQENRWIHENRDMALRQTVRTLRARRFAVFRCCPAIRCCFLG